jgi:Zn-dependent protease/CBS domain-containing protein
MTGSEGAVPPSAPGRKRAPTSPLTGGFPLGRLAGVPVRVHWSVFVIFAIIATSLATTTFPGYYPQAPRWVHVLSALSASVVFLLGLLAHEVSHAAVARRHGIAVDGITLWLFGGVASLRGEVDSPGTELRVAGVGPLVSALLGAAFGALALALRGLGVSGPLIGTLGWLAAVNLMLAAFNLVPAAPLDGGRLLYAGLWKWRGDRLWAAATAARAGRIFGFLLVALGVWQFAWTGAVTGLWPALLGWFLARAAGMEEQQARVEQSLSPLRVRDVMSANPDTAPADISVADLIENYIFKRQHSTFPILEGDGRMVGLMSLRRVKAVPLEARGRTRARDIACPLDQVLIATPDQPLLDLARRLEEHPDQRALVMDSGRLVGVLTPTDLVRAAQRSL